MTSTEYPEESAVCRLAHFGFLRVSGPDSASFMQGYTTCELSDMAEDEARLGAVCNLKGRMIASFLAIRQGTDLWLRMDRALVPVLIDFLKKYIVFSKAEMSDESDTLACYGYLQASEEAHLKVSSDADGYTVDLGNRVERWHLGGAIAAAAAITEWQGLELDAGMVWVTADTTETYLPQMLNYHELGAINFQKGCYLGQEIVARMQYRGELKRRLHQITVESEHQIGDKLMQDGKAVGEVVAIAGQKVLAVLQNTEEGLTHVQFEDGESLSATPV